MSGLPVPLLRGFTSLVPRVRKRSIRGITLKVSTEDKHSLSRLRVMLSEVGGTKCSFRVLFLSTRSDILIGHCGRAHEDRPLTVKKEISSKVQVRERGVHFLGRHTSCVVSADGLLAERLGRRVSEVFMSGRSFYGVVVSMLSFKFGCKVPTSTSLIFSIHFLPGPCCISRLEPLAKLSSEIFGCMVSYSVTEAFTSGLRSVIGFLVPGCIGRKGAGLIVTVKYANNGRHSIALTERLCSELSKGAGCKFELRRESTRGSQLIEGRRK